MEEISTRLQFFAHILAYKMHIYSFIKWKRINLLSQNFEGRPSFMLIFSFSNSDVLAYHIHEPFVFQKDLKLFLHKTLFKKLASYIYLEVQRVGKTELGSWFHFYYQFFENRKGKYVIFYVPQNIKKSIFFDIVMFTFI